jgi:hypothetical protein
MATKKWSAKVDTDSTHPDEGLFNQSASAIAKALASKKVSPQGPASGMRMLNFYINRAGKNLSASRKAELEKAKTLRNHRQTKIRIAPQSDKETHKKSEEVALEDSPKSHQQEIFDKIKKQRKNRRLKDLSSHHLNSAHQG